MPPFEKGWQRSNRFIPKSAPRRTPRAAIASAQYAEQLGTNRQAGGSHGDTACR